MTTHFKFFRFHSDIEALALQLEKLLKVIKHSDPSAAQIKHLLYEKYKQKIAELAKEIRQATSWYEFNRYLDSLLLPDMLSVADDAREIVVKKLVKDFEAVFIERHQLSELSPPEPSDTRQRERIKKIRKQIRNNRKHQHPTFNTDDLSDMFLYRHQQKTGKKSLDRLVKALSKIDLQKVD